MKETIMRMCVVAHFALSAMACNGPTAMLPGGELSGPVESTDSWTFASEFESLELETRPRDPYSVRIGFVLRDGALYIDPAEERRWYQYLKDDANVRVRFAEIIYPAKALEVTADEEKAGFDPTRHVFRLEPRN